MFLCISLFTATFAPTLLISAQSRSHHLWIRMPESTDIRQFQILSPAVLWSEPWSRMWNNLRNASVCRSQGPVIHISAKSKCNCPQVVLWLKAFTRLSHSLWLLGNLRPCSDPAAQPLCQGAAALGGKPGVSAWLHLQSDKSVSASLKETYIVE